MEEQAGKSSGCFGKILTIIIIAIVLKQLGLGSEIKNKADAKSEKVDSTEVKQLETIKDSIVEMLSGTYEGALYSDEYIPAAHIYPGYINYTISIYNIQVEGRKRNVKSPLVSNMDQAHFVAEVKAIGVDQDGFTAQSSGNALFFPQEGRICFWDANGGSLLGKEPCKFSLYKNNLVSPDGNLMKENKKTPKHHK